MATGRTNIILCMTDDQGWGDTGFNGHPRLQTPHLDAMAAEGITFNRWYAAAPVCSPTRGSAITGRHPYRYGIFFANVGHLPPQEVTIAEVLKEHGYTTGHFGKWHLGTLTRTLLDGRRGEQHERNRPMGFESQDQVALTADRYKIYRAASEKPFELYDLQSDPGETEDIAGRHPHVVAQMVSDLESWRQSCNESRAGADWGEIE